MQPADLCLTESRPPHPHLSHFPQSPPFSVTRNTTETLVSTHTQKSFSYWALLQTDSHLLLWFSARQLLVLAFRASPSILVSRSWFSTPWGKNKNKGKLRDRIWYVIFEDNWWSRYKILQTMLCNIQTGLTWSNLLNARKTKQQTWMAT